MLTNKRLKLEIVTPEQIIFSDFVDFVSAPGEEGELGILPRHAALVSILQPGELRIKKGEDEIFIAVSGGFMEIKQDNIIVLADVAERDDSIDAQKAEEAKRRAEKALTEVKNSRIDKSEAEAALRYELARLKAVKKRKNKDKKII
jgi:F-type H+-transporting ATPase subunit epsilon